MSKNHVVVLVLGDIGRSPRMQYHARSFSALNNVDRVTMIGYKGENPIEELRSNSKVYFQYVSPITLPTIRYLSFLRAILKGILLLFALFQSLWTIPHYHLIIIQNPPCLPAVMIAFIFSRLNGSKLIIDWHNLGFSIYENSIGKKTTLVKFTYLLEKLFCGWCADRHICVSKALSEWLKINFDIIASVLYDRPGVLISEKYFTDIDRHNLLFKLQLTDQQLFGVSAMKEEVVQETIQTYQLKNGEIERKGMNGNPKTALVISSTSWTADEDFSILLSTMEQLEAYLKENSLTSTQNNGVLYDKIACVITGKGELKSLYEEKIANFNERSRSVKIKTLWLEFADYPKLLYCSDVGVSLHTSTSGLDLPMKILDMFGSSLPVLAIEFPTIHEIVQVNVNGLVFTSQTELFNHFRTLLLSESKSDQALLQSLRQNCRNIENWKTNWDRIMPNVYSCAF